FVFFFSSRRRHTRFSRDWSSDVCSSDLGVFTQSWVAGSRSQSALEVPLVIPQAAWLVGLAVFLVTALMLLAHALTLGVRGDLVEMSRTISTRSAAEEIDDEVRALAEQRAREARAQCSASRSSSCWAFWRSPFRWRLP